MATINTRNKAPRTHEGAVACHINPEQQLRRSVMACLLWEGQFYEDGIEIATRITQLVDQVEAPIVKSIALEARNKMKLRHVPLLLAVKLARLSKLDAELLDGVIQRTDELTEFLAIYWKDGRCPISAQAKKGLARAFIKFNAYQLAKYNRDTKVKLRDVLFMCHAKPKDKEQEQVWKKLIDGTLESPDTWEVSLSAGKDKKQTWERLLTENKLGGLALIRNLRNMEQVKVQRSLIQSSIENMNVSRVLPFRFIAAAKAAPSFEPELEKALFRCTKETERIRGTTVVVVDCSGSMTATLSAKSIMTRFDAASAIAMICREVCENVRVFAYGTETAEVAPRRGFALRDTLRNSNVGYGTYLGQCIAVVNNKVDEYDRVIVFTDEQTADEVPNFRGKGYVVNVASCKNGIGYDKWIHIDGWSEAVLRYIQEYEGSLKT